jgi:hypothetical protein
MALRRGEIDKATLGEKPNVSAIAKEVFFYGGSRLRAADSMLSKCGQIDFNVKVAGICARPMVGLKAYWYVQRSSLTWIKPALASGS